jgi:hypothetical protein
MHTELHERLEHAQADLSQYSGGLNSSNIVGCLWFGLITLRKLFLARLQRGIESPSGTDSIWAPLTFVEAKREFRHATEEIDIYSLLVVVAEAEHSGYANGDMDWFRDWLLRLRWGVEIESATWERLQAYETRSDGERRRMFASFLEQALPEATTTPLVIYRLYPRAVRIATALAFGDVLRAREVRSEQMSYLPVIGDCHQCHGLPLENGEICPECGNPLWKISWLCVTE